MRCSTQRYRPLLSCVAAALLVVGTACTAGRRPPAPTADQIPELRTELRESPDDVDAMVRLAAAYQAAGQPKRALPHLVEARRRFPDNAASLFYLGLVREDLERYDEAREAYRSYLDLEGSGRLAGAAERRLTLLRRQELLASVRQTLERESELADRVPDERTVAVFPFQYRGDDPRFRPLGRALAEFLVTDLSRTEALTVLERSRLQLLLDEMELSESDYVEPGTAVQSGRLLGAANLVQGMLEGNEAEMGMEASVIDARQPPPDVLEPVASGSRPAREIFELESEIALSVYRSLGVELTSAQRERITGPPTRDLDAVLAFGRGLMAQDTANFGAAARHFDRAVQIDPNFSQAVERLEIADQLSAAASMNVDGLARLAASEGVLGSLVSTAAAARDLAVDRTSIAPLPFQRDPLTELLGKEGFGTTSGFVEIIIDLPVGTP